MSPYVSVKTKPGRVAFSAPRGGDAIPHDRYVPVERTPWIERLISVHGDIEVEPATRNAPAAPSSEKKPAPAAQ